MAGTVAEITADRTWMTFDLVTKLAVAVGTSERKQERFRVAVLTQLARIQTIVEMIHAAQLVEARRKNPRDDDEKIEEDAAAAEKFIAEKARSVASRS